MKNIIFEITISFIIAVGFVVLLFGAVMQQSYKNAPPTPQEIEENPSLARYLE